MQSHTAIKVEARGIAESGYSGGKIMGGAFDSKLSWRPKQPREVNDSQARLRITQVEASFITEYFKHMRIILLFVSVRDILFQT